MIVNEAKIRLLNCYAYFIDFTWVMVSMADSESALLFLYVYS